MTGQGDGRHDERPNGQIGQSQMMEAILAFGEIGQVELVNDANLGTNKYAMFAYDLNANNTVTVKAIKAKDGCDLVHETILPFDAAMDHLTGIASIIGWHVA